VHLLLAAGCCALVLLPFALPYFQVQRELGFERALADSEPFSASLRQYLMVPPGSVVHGRWLSSDDTPIAGGYPVDALFPGLVALALGIWGLFRGQGRARWFFCLLLLMACCLSFGPRLYLAPGKPAGLNITLPYAWLYATVPGFKALRAPVRFDALVTLALAVLAGYGVASWPGKRSFLLLTACCSLLVGESLVWPAARAERVPVGEQVPSVYRWLAEQPSSAVLEVPMAFTPDGPRLDYQYFSTYHWHPTPDGYSGFIPPKHGQIVYEMEHVPSERSVSLLQAMDVCYVVIHTDRYPVSRWPEMRAALARTDDLTWVETFDADQVYAVKPREFAVEDLTVQAYIPPQVKAGQPATAYLIILNSGPRSYAVQPTDRFPLDVCWDDTCTGLAAELPLVTSPDGGAAVVSLPLKAPAVAGRYRLSLIEHGDSLGGWTLEGAVQVGDRADTAFPVPARLQAWDLPPTARPGQPLDVHLTWHALGKIDAYYSIYVKLLDADGNAIAGWDGQPRNGKAPTLLWAPGERVEDTVTLTVPADAPSGDYTVEVGMYHASDLARCLTLNEDGAPLESVVLGVVRVE
jgi:hypothetical protein